MAMVWAAKVRDRKARKVTTEVMEAMWNRANNDGGNWKWQKCKTSKRKEQTKNGILG